MTLNRGQVITIGNYRDFSMSITDAALGAIKNSTAWTLYSDDVKIAIVDEVLGLMSSQSTLSGAELVEGVESAAGITDTSLIEHLFDGKVAGGICYNRELYNQKLEWDQFENVTYQVDITQSQLDSLQSAMGQYNYFSLLENSCASVAVGLWNAALGEDSEYALSANGTGVYSFIQEPKYVRQSIEDNLTGYKTNKLDSVEEEGAAATTDGVTYYVTAPSAVVSNYVFDEGNLLSVDAGRSSLDALRYAGMLEPSTPYTYPADSADYGVAIAAEKSVDGLNARYEVDSVTFSYDGIAVSELADYDGSVWFTAPVTKDSVVTDGNGNRLTSYYDAAQKQVSFKVSSLPATCVVQPKADVECSNLSVTSDGEQEVYYYNGDEAVAVSDASTLDEGETIYIKPTAMTNKVVESMTLTAAGEVEDIKGSYDAEEGAYRFVMPGTNAEVAIHYVDATIVENDDRSVIQVEKGTQVNLAEHFSVETASASKAEMEASLKFEVSAQTPGIVNVSEDGTLQALGEGKASVKVFLSDSVFTLVAIDVYDGDMVSVTFEDSENGTFAIQTAYEGVTSDCYYSGYLVKKGSEVDVVMLPAEGYAVSGAYYATGLPQSPVRNEIRGTFVADQDVAIEVSFAKAEIADVPDTVSLDERGTYQLEPSLRYTEQSGDVFDGELTYASSDEAIVKVSEDGTITAVSNGIAVVSVSAASGNKVSKACSVNVGDVDGNAVVGRLTVSARPPTTDQLVPHGFVTFTSYEDGVTMPGVNYDRYYEYLQEYRDTINAAEDGVDGRLYNDSISQEVRETYFDDHGDVAGTADLSLDKGDAVTLSAYTTASNEKVVMDAFVNGDIAQYPSFQEMYRIYQNLATDQDKVALFDSSLATLTQVFTDIYVNGKANPVNGKTDGGINVNRELYNQFRRDDSMTPNNSYTVEITANELAHLKAYLANPDNNYYSFAVHNCATAAAEIWNATLYDQENLHVSADYSLFGDEPVSLYASVGNLMASTDKAGLGVANFVPGPGKESDIEDLTEYSTLTIADTEHGTITVTDADGNEYQSGDQVKKGTVLTVACSCDEGYLLDYLHVNGVSLSGTTFTVSQDINLLASFCEAVLSLDKTALTMSVGDDYQLSATMRHTADEGYASIDDVIFESSDSSIAQVDEDGIIHALKPGVVRVTATAKYGNGIYGRCYLIVKDAESSQDVVGKLMIVGRASDSTLGEDQDLGRGFFQFTSSQDGVAIDVTDVAWLYQPTKKYYKAVNTYDGTGKDPVTYHKWMIRPDSLFTKVTDMAEIGNTYTLNRGEIFTIGVSEDSATSTDGTAVPVVTINNALYQQASECDQYPNTTFEVAVTRDQLAALMLYLGDYVNDATLDKTSSEVAAEAWNVVTSEDADLEIDADSDGSMSGKDLQSEITRIAADREGYEVNHKVFKAEKTNFVVYDDTLYVVKDGEQVVKPYELVDQGTTLTVYCVNEEGDIDTSKSVSGVSPYGYMKSGNTFTMNTIRADLTCKTKDLPAITGQPQSVVAEAGDVVTMTVTAKGSVKKYRWQYSADGGVTWVYTKWLGNYNFLDITMTKKRDGYLWRCIVTFTDGTVITSDAATTLLTR